jgi:hypothetical protein
MKPMNLFRIFLVLAIPLAAGVSQAAVYYLSTTGSDSNSCSQAQSEATPKKTINNAISCLSAGSTLLIRNGTYTTQNQLPGIPSGTSWTSPVTIAAYPGDQPVLKTGQSGYDVIQFIGNSYIILDGLIIDGSGGNNGITIDYSSSGTSSTAHHIRVTNSEVRNAPNQGIYVGAGSYGGYNEFINLKIHHNGTDSLRHGMYVTASNNLIERCEVYNNSGYGLHLYDEGGFKQVNNNTVRLNRLYNNGQWGLILSSGTGNMAYNNIMWSNGQGGINIQYGNVRNTQVYNNTIYNSSPYGLYIGSSSSNATVRNNIVYQSGGIQNQGVGTVLSNDLTTDPKFVNPAGADFHLQAGSPAINAGTAVGIVTTDFDGLPRPQDTFVDIGAYEFASTATLVAPTNLIVISQ